MTTSGHNGVVVATSLLELRELRELAEGGRMIRGAVCREVSEGKIGEDMEDIIYPPGQGKEEGRKITLSWTSRIGERWPGIKASGRGSSTGRRKRVATATPESGEREKDSNLSVNKCVVPGQSNKM